ncbi:LOW QUALITY PROTEIN: ETHYLENE INSENSITIVE 3-like 1 protein [Cinnamomum micranthum f. kanehirae]|uniref:ETHYLENE INSENSITIVE 3-like 1 protein n=1 Tax=Cinnamomum micranthum f. kanehirae TaxID=337451 RepID=A0A3S3NSG3_9MAGN|nr:LOW QUALITY PROTEIN: ETHYLENE INSENSITIVE 3-like 1 protein [Cinnamomum micranthum f. kanehirae]
MEISISETMTLEMKIKTIKISSSAEDVLCSICNVKTHVKDIGGVQSPGLCIWDRLTEREGYGQSSNNLLAWWKQKMKFDQKWACCNSHHQEDDTSLGINDQLTTTFSQTLASFARHYVGFALVGPILHCNPPQRRYISFEEGYLSTMTAKRIKVLWQVIPNLYKDT